jgi:hypothetical protein
MFVRSRSAFLFTSILAASALFQKDAAALSKRLSTHRDRLAQRVIEKKHRSVEIVLAFMVQVIPFSLTLVWFKWCSEVQTGVVILLRQIQSDIGLRLQIKDCTSAL